jgi:hypothetical protein
MRFSWAGVYSTVVFRLVSSLTRPPGKGRPGGCGVTEIKDSGPGFHVREKGLPFEEDRGPGEQGTAAGAEHAGAPHRPDVAGGGVPAHAHGRRGGHGQRHGRGVRAAVAGEPERPARTVQTWPLSCTAGQMLAARNCLASWMVLLAVASSMGLPV